MHGRASFTDPESLVDYVDRYGTAGQAVAYATRSGKVTVVLNAGTSEQPGWEDHRAIYMPERSEEMTQLFQIDGAYNRGTYLAEWIEDWRHIIVDPVASDLLEVVGKFRAATKGTVVDESDDATGSTVLHVAQTNEAKTKVPVPDAITVEVPVFAGDQFMLMVEGRFRWRLDNGRAEFGVRFPGLKQLYADAVQARTAEVGDLLGLPIWWGDRGR